jgi:hypothetical protein
MRHLAPALVLLAASCSPPPPDLSAITKELASLRQGLDELKKIEQPKFDSEQAMVDLTKEVQRLRDRLAQPAPAAAVPLPALPALSVPQAGILAGGVGGTQAGVNDLYWVLGKISVDKEDRIVLALYQTLGGNRGFKLIGVRMLNADLQILELGGDKPSVREVVEALRRQQPK